MNADVADVLSIDDVAPFIENSFFDTENVRTF